MTKKTGSPPDGGAGVKPKVTRKRSHVTDYECPLCKLKYDKREKGENCLKLGKAEDKLRQEIEQFKKRNPGTVIAWDDRFFLVSYSKWHDEKQCGQRLVIYSNDSNSYYPSYRILQGGYEIVSLEDAILKGFYLGPCRSRCDYERSSVIKAEYSRVWQLIYECLFGGEIPPEYQAFIEKLKKGLREDTMEICTVDRRH
ncbi:MAG TPA: hypothetical protein ENF20_02070 [Candidatus Marinimicrobia bacterium]|nr:hypothetical protein [Candidatus Neomarinimicrobiota bacterium]